jgi:hypothetical protein
MKYKFLLNGTDITSRVELGANVKERFAEELDVGGISLSYWDTGDAIKVLSRVDIQELEDDNETIVKEYNMLVLQDTVSPITKQSPIKYRHQLDLIELTHKLDYFVINALGFTQPIEDLKKAPFTHKYFSVSGNTSSEGNGIGLSGFAVEFPEIEEIYNRYINGEINVSIIPPAKIWFVPGTQDTEATLRDEKDLSLKLYFLNEIVVNNVPTVTETLITTHNISQSDFNITSLANGKYKILISAEDTFQLYSTDPPNSSSYNRYSEYFVDVEANPRYTLYDVLSRIRDVSPIEKKSIHAQTRLFDISQELEDKLKLIEAPQLYMNRLTTREALNDALKYVNAISRLINNENDILSADFFNERQGNNTFSLTEVFETVGLQTSANYTSVNRAFLANAINSNALDNPSVVELGDNLYKGIRSQQFQVLPETGILKLQYDIYRLLSVKTKVSVQLEWVNIPTLGSGSVQFTSIEELEIDLLPYIVEQNILEISRKINDVFGSSGKLNEFNRDFFRDKEIELATYNFATNVIDLGGTVGSIFYKTKLNRIIESAVSEKLSHFQGRRYKDETGEYSGIVVYKQNKINPKFQIRQYNGNTLNFENNDYVLQIPLNVTYIAIEDNILDSHKEDTSIIDKYTEKQINLNAQVVNFERASISNYGIGQRLGVPTINYGKINKHDDNEEVGYVNQNNEVVVEKEQIFYPDHKVYSYTASRDFNRLSQFIQVDRAYRPYENPLKRFTIQRNDIYNEFIEYSTSSDVIIPTQNDTFISNLSLETIINTLKRDSNLGTDFVKIALMRTDGFLKQYPDFEDASMQAYIRNALIIPVISQGGKNILSFKFGFKNKISAGDTIRENTNEVNTIEDLFNELRDTVNNFFSGTDYSARPYGWWREFVTYGDRNGYFNEMHFQMLTDFNVNEATYGKESNGFFGETQFLPLISESTSSQLSYFPSQTNKTAFASGNGVSFNDAMIIKKDSSEIYSFTYQVAFTPKSIEDNEKIVIGRAFTSQNLLVYPFKDKTLKLYVYNDDNKYSKFDDEFVKSGYTNSYNLTGVINILNYLNTIPYGIEISLSGLSNSTHWAIGDEEGKLYLANNTNNPYVFFEPRNKRSTINYDW